MKQIFLFTYIFFLGVKLFAQAPSGYYDGTENLRGEALKHALYDIIKGHTEFPYTSTSTDVWDILKETDKDTINPDNVILFYTGWSVDGEQEYNNGQGWSREHVWAKSRGDFGTSPPAGTDVNNLRPADISVNSARNNRSFDTCSIPYLDNGIETGCYTDYERWVWQPREEVLGDVARMIFYMATRYEGEFGEPDLELVDFLPDRFDNSPIHALLSTLLIWNEEDAVDDYELHRNDVIYFYQQNRNPFIDHPEFINKIWGSDTIPNTILNRSEINISIYPNPVKDILHFHNSQNLDKEIFTKEGALIKKTKSSTINVQSLSPGLYIVVFKNQEGNILKVLKFALFS